MRQILLSVNITLTIFVVIFAFYLMRDQSNANVPSGDILQRSGDKILMEMEDEPAQDEKITKKDSKVVWEKNLFHPNRTYEHTVEEVTISDPDKVTEHFELISIAQVGPISCASIRVIKNKNQKRSRVNRNRRTRSTSRRRTSTNRNQKAKKVQKSKNNENQKIYRLNDPVGETGYELISIDIRCVKLQKNIEPPIELCLDTKDEHSAGRREIALKAEQERISKATAKKEKEAKEEKKSKNTDLDKEKKTKETTDSSLPPPPPPPPLSNLPNFPDFPSRGNPNGGVDEKSLEESTEGSGP